MATKTKLFIGTPCYGGMLSVAYFQAIMQLTEHLRSKGIEFEVFTKSNESLITRARNTLVAEFIGRTEFTHLLWIDADMGFEPELISKMLAFDKHVVAAACPMKNIDWNRVLGAARKASDAATLRNLSMQFNVNFISGKDNQIQIEDGFAQVSMVGTGIMMIRRDTFEVMRERLPDCRYVNDIAGYENPYTKDNFHGFFDTMTHPQTRRYLSEDFAFCYRWRELCGGEIYINIDHTISHYGNYPFKGAFKDTLI